MATNKVYAGTVGLRILIEMNATITGATGLKLYVRREGQSDTTWTPTIYGTTQLSYYTIAGDLTVGLLKINPYFTLGSWTGYGKTVEFMVYDKYE